MLRALQCVLALASIAVGGNGVHAREASTITADDVGRIRAVLSGTWDLPDAPLRVAPVSIEGDHAIAGWLQGERGGRALLRRHAGEWRVHLCGGDALLDPAVLVQAGVPDGHAKALATAERDAERALPRDQVSAFSRFGALVHMGEGAHAGHAQPPRVPRMPHRHRAERRKS